MLWFEQGFGNLCPFAVENLGFSVQTDKDSLLKNPI